MKRNFHFLPALKRFKRKMAVVLPKDAGAIIAYSGISKDSRVLEIGAGNGFLTYYLAKIAKEVISYEIREDAFAILSKNLDRAGLKNVKAKNQDGKKFREKGFDAIIADIPDAHEIVEKVHSALKDDGTFVAYLPNVNQIEATYRKCKGLFNDVFVLSIVSYELRVHEKGTRPENNCLFHTAYLLFARK